MLFDPDELKDDNTFKYVIFSEPQKLFHVFEGVKFYVHKCMLLYIYEIHEICIPQKFYVLYIVWLGKLMCI